MPLGIITRPDTSALTPRSFCKYAHRVQEQLAGGEGLDEERGDRDHDAVGKHESGGQPLHDRCADREFLHQCGLGDVQRRFRQDAEERQDGQRHHDDDEFRGDRLFAAVGQACG